MFRQAALLYLTLIFGTLRLFHAIGKLATFAVSRQNPSPQPPARSGEGFLPLPVSGRGEGFRPTQGIPPLSYLPATAVGKAKITALLWPARTSIVRVSTRVFPSTVSSAFNL